MERFTDVYAVQGQNPKTVVESPARMNEVLILTLCDPSWVAWREVRVLPTPFEDPLESDGAPQPTLNRITSGLDGPVHVTRAGDGSWNVYVVEHPERIRIFQGGEIAEISFLDI